MSGMRTKAFAARRLCTAALEKSRQACSSSVMALAANGERGPRVTMVPKTTWQLIKKL